MAEFDYNRPNTRARVEARRRQRRSSGPRDSWQSQPSGLVQRMNTRWRPQVPVRQKTRRRTAPADQGSVVVAGTWRRMLAWVTSGRLFSLLLATAALTVLFHMFTSPDFVVRTVELSGGSILSQEHVARLADVDGLPIWFLPTDLVAQRVQSDPFVEQVSVSLALPDKLYVTIVERQPELRWQMAGVQYLVDAHGTVLAAASETDPNALVIVEHGFRDLKPGDTVDTDALLLARQLKLRLAEMVFSPAMIGWDIALGVFVRTPSGQTIVFGQSEAIERKLAIVQYLLNDSTPFTYLDLRPETPFYRNDVPSPPPDPAASPVQP